MNNYDTDNDNDNDNDNYNDNDNDSIYLHIKISIVRYTCHRKTHISFSTNYYCYSHNNDGIGNNIFIPDV